METYQSLKKSFVDYVVRDDTPFDMLLKLTEQRINTNLRVYRMLSRQCQKIGETPEQFISLPPNFLQAQSLYIEGDDFIRINFKLIGKEIKLPNKLTDKTVQMVYYKRVPALNEQDNKNDFLEAYPELYLNGLLLEYNIWADDTENASKYLQLFAEILERIEYADNMAYGGGQDFTDK